MLYNDRKFSKKNFNELIKTDIKRVEILGY